MADDDSDVKVTAYGYKGDTTSDTASAHAIGDRDNPLSATPEHQSVALTESEREARFGVKGKSTGLSFTYQGKTYYDEDTAPESDKRIDVFDPAHPPDKPSALLRKAPRLLPESAEQYAPSEAREIPEAQLQEPLAESPEPESKKPQPKDERPVDTVRKNYPEYSKLSDNEVSKKLTEVFPDVPADRLKIYATQPGGAKLIQEYQDRGLNPLEKFRKHYPNLATLDDDKDLQWLRLHFQPDMGEAQFKALANPPGPVLSTLGHLYDFLTSATVGAVEQSGKLFQPQADLSKNLENIREVVEPKANEAPKPQTLGLMSALSSFYGKYEQFPKAVTNVAAAADIFGWEKAASDWLTQYVPNYGRANDLFRHFVTGLSNRGKAWEQQAKQQAAAIPPGAGAQVAGTFGQVAGSIPDIAVSFGLGSVGRAAALWGMSIEGVSAWGHAIEHHQKNELLEGVNAAGFRQFTQYLLNTGKGRIVSGIANMFATVANEEIEKWIRGEPNDITKDGKAATIGLLLPILLGPKAGEGREAFLEAEPPEKRVPKTELSIYDYAGEESILARHAAPTPEPKMELGPKGIDLPGQQWEKFLSQEKPTGKASAPSEKPAVREELTKAQEAHANGDHDAAANYIDRAFTLMPDGEKRQVAQDFIDKVDELAAEPKKTTTDEVFNDYYFAGLPAYIKSLRERKAKELAEPEPAKAEADPQHEAVRQHPGRSWNAPRVDSPEIPPELENFPHTHEQWRKMSPQERGTYLHQWIRSTGGRGTEFYAGVPFKGVAQAIKDWFESERPGILPLIPKTDVEYISKGAETAGQIIKSEEARSRAAMAVGPATIYRKAVAATGRDPLREPHGLFEKISGLRFGAPMERMERFFNNFSKPELLQQFIDYQDKGASAIKDPTARWLWQNVLGPTYDAIEKRDSAYGIEYDHRENYFYQLLTHPSRDQPRLENSVAKALGGLPFAKPRQMRLVERLALGHEMITTNPVRLMQMRWWASERAIQKIRDIKQLEAEGLAFDTRAKGANIPPDRKRWISPNNVFATADKRSYYVDPDIIPVLNNKFDSNDLFRSAGAPLWKFAAALKGATAAKVSWSLFHPLHIMDITQADVATDALQRILAGQGGWSDAFNLALNEVPFAGSIPAGTRAYFKYADAVNFLGGRLDWDQLSPETKRDVSDFMDMGLVAGVSEERQMQFTQWLQENGPSWIRKGGSLVKTGFDILGNPLGFNKWWFGTVTPRLKFASAMMRRDTLLRTRPELFRDINRMERLREFQKFHRDIEGRYGEMHYDNLLWPRMFKQAGTTFMLSMGWQLGMFRTMGDSVVDLTRNTAHIREIMDGWKTRDPAARKLITNRMIFSALYLTRGLLTGWAISYFLGGKKQPDFWDGIYPVVGQTPDGKDKRVNMQYFIKDVPSLMQYSAMEDSLAGGILRMSANKMNPMLLAVGQAAMNKDYLGRRIGDLQQRMLYLLQGTVPISFENMAVPGQTPSDKLLDFLGFAPSGRWTMRSELENRIIADASEARNYAPLMDARDRYRQAFLAKDRDAMQKAHEDLMKMQVTEKQIRNIEKDAHIPTAHKLFKELLPWQQEARWKEMTPAERREYWPLVKKELISSGRIRM